MHKFESHLHQPEGATALPVSACGVGTAEEQRQRQPILWPLLPAEPVPETLTHSLLVFVGIIFN